MSSYSLREHGSQDGQVYIYSHVRLAVWYTLGKYRKGKAWCRFVYKSYTNLAPKNAPLVAIVLELNYLLTLISLKSTALSI